MLICTTVGKMSNLNGGAIPDPDKFTDTEKLHLVTLYRDRPALWDVSSREYKDRQKRAAAYLDIAQKIDKSVDAIKSQINGLRTQYLAAHKKAMARRPMGQHLDETPRQSEWWLYNELSFLSDAVRTRQSVSNLDCSQATEKFTKAGSESAGSVSHSVVYGNESNSLSPSIMSDANLSVPWPAAAGTAQCSNKLQASSEKRRRQETDDRLLCCVQDMVKLASTSQPVEDEDVAFGKMVTSELHAIKDRKLKRKLKSSIARLLFDPAMSNSTD